MNLTISPFNSIASNNKLSFKGFSGDCGDCDDEDRTVSYNTYKEDLKRARTNGTNKGLITGTLATAIIMAIGAGIHEDNITKNNQKALDNFASKVDSVAKSNDINKNAFMVKDMNDDDKPDFVLFKKDGAKVVLDIANKQILEEKNKLDVIY